MRKSKISTYFLLHCLDVTLLAYHNQQQSFLKSQFLEMLQLNPKYLAVPDIEAARQLAFLSSPNAQINQWRSPVLLIHGDDDRSASFSQTVDLAQKLRDRNVSIEVLVVPDEVHDFLLHASFLRPFGFEERCMISKSTALSGHLSIFLRSLTH